MAAAAGEGDGGVKLARAADSAVCRALGGDARAAGAAGLRVRDRVWWRGRAAAGEVSVALVASSAALT